MKFSIFTGKSQNDFPFFMNYSIYFFQLLFLFSGFSACLYYFGDQNFYDSIFISAFASVLTVMNKFFLDKKKLKRKNNQKA